MLYGCIDRAYFSGQEISKDLCRAILIEFFLSQLLLSILGFASATNLSRLNILRLWGVT